MGARAAVSSEERVANIKAALKTTRGNVSEAAHLLGLARPSLWWHLRALGLGGEPKRIRDARRRRFVLPPVTAA